MQTPKATASLPTFKKGVCYTKTLLARQHAVHVVRTRCNFTTLRA